MAGLFVKHCSSWYTGMINDLITRIVSKRQSLSYNPTTAKCLLNWAIALRSPSSLGGGRETYYRVEGTGPTGATWAWTLAETGVPRWQAITETRQTSFQQTPSPPSTPQPPPPPPQNPDTCPDPKSLCVSTAIRVIADYTRTSLARMVLVMHQFMEVLFPILLKVY